MTGSLLSFFPVIFCVHTVCLSKDVTGHCSFYCIAIPKSLFLPDYFGLTLHLCLCSGLLLRSHSVSVQRRDRSLFFSRFALPSPPFYLIFSSFPNTSGSPQDFLSLYFHSVSVQRRGRDSVIHFGLAWSLWLPPLPSICAVCLSKDVTGTLFLTLIFRKTLSVFRCSLLVTQCICPKTWQVLCYLPHSPPF